MDGEKQHYIKVNLPDSPEHYEEGRGEGCFFIVDDRTKAAYDADENGTVYEGILDNDSLYFPGLTHGATLPVEMRGTARPVVPYEALEGYLKRYSSAEEEVLAVLDSLEGRAAQRLKKYLEKRKAEDLDEYESIIGAIYLKKTDDPGTLAQSIINAANILKEWGEL